MHRGCVLLRHSQRLLQSVERPRDGGDKLCSTHPPDADAWQTKNIAVFVYKPSGPGERQLISGFFKILLLTLAEIEDRLSERIRERLYNLSSSLFQPEFAFRN